MSLALPAVLFAFATWQNSRDIAAKGDERIERTLDVLQEHALKALQTVERSISEINEVMRGVPDEFIRANESDFYLRFKRTQQALPQIESIWVFDRTGRPLASSTILPVPRTLDNSDRGYFKAQAERDAGIYIGEVIKARIGGLQFFVVSGRRDGLPGRFDGIVGVTVMPEHFIEFYRKLARGQDAFALARADGTVLARYPEAPNPATNQPSPLMQAIERNAEGGLFTAISRQDHVERRAGYRKVPGFPVYVTAAIETSAYRQQLWSTALWQLAVGLPAVLALFALSIYALRRAQRFELEVARREAAETALKQAQRLEAIGQLTGGVAHDFNNLLMVVSGNAELLQKNAALDARGRRSVEALLMAVKRGTDLTRQLLSFSRRQTHEARVLDLRERLPAVQGMLRSSLRGDITIDLAVGETVWNTKVDDSEFELALLNLAVNARDAMGTGGRLAIAARNVTLVKPNTLDLAGDFVAVSISDTGSGIAPEVLGRVFEPFFTTKEVGKGTGLGLSQVYGFARQAGGTATVESAPGQGTTVTLYLPRSDEPVEQEKTVEPVAPGAATRVRVLLVEDNADVLAVTRGFLESYGYVVEVAREAAAARLLLLASSNRRYDIVLSDIVMPGGDTGLDLARWIRQERGASLPVVLATGYSDQAQAAADAGFTILRKPYDAASLHAALADALRQVPRKEVA